MVEVGKQFCHEEKVRKIAIKLLFAILDPEVVFPYTSDVTLKSSLSAQRTLKNPNTLTVSLVCFELPLLSLSTVKEIKEKARSV